MGQLFSAAVASLTDATAGTGTAIAVNHARRTSVTLKWSTGSTGGTAVVEAADTPGYAGTWTVLATRSWSAANSADLIEITDPVGAVRSRITSPITGTGGSLSALVQAWS